MEKIIAFVSALAAQLGFESADGYVSGLAQSRVTPTLVGPPGGGKTSLIREICRMLGWDLVYIPASSLSEAELAGAPTLADDGSLQKSEGSLIRDLKSRTRPTLVFIDEIGCVAASAIGGRLELALQSTLTWADLLPPNVGFCAATNEEAQNLAGDLLPATRYRLLMFRDFTVPEQAFAEYLQSWGDFRSDALVDLGFTPQVHKASYLPDFRQVTKKALKEAVREMLWGHYAPTGRELYRKLPLETVGTRPYSYVAPSWCIVRALHKVGQLTDFVYKAVVQEICTAAYGQEVGEFLAAQLTLCVPSPAEVVYGGEEGADILASLDTGLQARVCSSIADMAMEEGKEVEEDVFNFLSLLVRKEYFLPARVMLDALVARGLELPPDIIPVAAELTKVKLP